MTVRLRKWLSPDGSKNSHWAIRFAAKMPDGTLVGIRQNAAVNTRQDALDEETELRRQIRDGTYRPRDAAVHAPAAESMTVQRFASGVWLPRNERECAHGTQLFYKECLKHVEAQLHDIPVKDLRFAHVERFKAYLQGEAGLAPATVNNVLATLRAMLTYAEECGEFGEGGRAPKVKLVPVPDPAKPKYLSAEQLVALLEWAKGARWYVLFVVLVETGLRIGEAIALQWGDIDMPGTMLHVRRTYYRGREDPAGSAARRIPLSAAAMEALRGIQKQSLYVFPTKRKGQWSRMTEASPRAAWGAAKAFLQAHESKVLEQVSQEFEGVERFQRTDSFGPHALRHTFGTHKVSEGVSLEVLATLMGHASTETTKIYAKVTDEALRAAMGQKRETK